MYFCVFVKNPNKNVFFTLIWFFFCLIYCKATHFSCLVFLAIVFFLCQDQKNVFFCYFFFFLLSSRAVDHLLLKTLHIDSTAEAVNSQRPPWKPEAHMQTQASVHNPSLQSTGCWCLKIHPPCLHTFTNTHLLCYNSQTRGSRIFLPHSLCALKHALLLWRNISITSVFGSM